jgi:Na+-transporting NADH:ubiquinone oxidoreductase subunit NqrB
MSTVVISTLFVLTTFIPASVTVWIFRLALLVLGLGFVLNIKVKKPDMKSGAIFLGAQILMLLILLIAGDCQAPII